MVYAHGVTPPRTHPLRDEDSLLYRSSSSVNLPNHNCTHTAHGNTDPLRQQSSLPGFYHVSHCREKQGTSGEILGLCFSQNICTNWLNTQLLNHGRAGRPVGFEMELKDSWFKHKNVHKNYHCVLK